MTNLDPDPVRRPGRPTGAGTSRRDALLHAACALLIAPDTSTLTLQRVARTAGVTPALAHYYFGDRDGLVEAVIHHRAQPQIDALAQEARLRTDQPVNALTFLLQRLGGLMQADPVLRHCLWLPDAPARGLRQQLRGIACELVERAQHTGLLRTDLAATYLAGSLLGVALFPFLEADHGVDAGQASTLTLQHVSLLQHGILRAHSPRHESAE